MRENRVRVSRWVQNPAAIKTYDPARIVSGGYDDGNLTVTFRWNAVYSPPAMVLKFDSDAVDELRELIRQYDQTAAEVAARKASGS